ncbi:SPOR domain-containing protein [Methylomarinum vadi]|uniref:SPOR domain-containing protein n=1 Tax=Methylomarinum vadi TaxID=438855 RepID=UPI0004DF6A63|nr:SPOR domain-containing protein [Methylomarinum vadi]
MDQELKQRLVGAVVITALAAIFVPMLFDDPVDDTGKRINELKIPAIPEHMQENRLAEIPQSRDEVINLPVKQPLKTLTPSEEQAAKLKHWFLQVGLFSQQENAVSLRDKLRRQGFSAAVSQVTGDEGVMYKVKVGPELNRERAEVVQGQLKKALELNSFVIQE